MGILPLSSCRNVRIAVPQVWMARAIQLIDDEKCAKLEWMVGDCALFLYLDALLAISVAGPALPVRPPSLELHRQVPIKVCDNVKCYSHSRKHLLCFALEGCHACNILALLS